MDELATRLKEASDNCMKSYEAWSKDKKSASVREPLQEAVHELRKVAARLEIEVAVSERDANGKPLPIPGHRSQPKSGQKPAKKSPNKNNAPKASGNKMDDGNELPAFISGGAEPKEEAKAKKSSAPAAKKEA
ncbi:MAG: hypothetical protein ACPG05_01505 [Bdellovibrionales bacterium]